MSQTLVLADKRRVVLGPGQWSGLPVRSGTLLAWPGGHGTTNGGTPAGPQSGSATGNLQPFCGACYFKPPSVLPPPSTAAAAAVDSAAARFGL
ncbi:hypothetical protein MRX96_015624 [Rhipicephalus microplus]